MLKSDSPFPPLKSEHRYRGVYERAGFDVNLGSSNPQSPNDSKSFIAKKPFSPFKEKFSFAKPRRSSMSLSSGSRNSSRNPSIQNLASQRSHGSVSPSDQASRVNPSEKHIIQNQPHEENNASAFVPAPAQPLSKESSVDSSIQDQGSEQNPHPYHPFRAFLPDLQHSSNNGRFGLFDTQNTYIQLHDPTAFRKPSNEYPDRNVKGLCLDIPDSNNGITYKPENTTSGNTTAGLISELEANSPTFDRVADRSSTPNTSASSSGEFRKGSADSGISVKTSELTHNAPYPTGNEMHSSNPENLSSMLNEFRNDVEDHKKYDPRSKPMAKAAHAQSDNVNLFVPSTGDLSATFNRAVLSDGAVQQTTQTNNESEFAPYPSVDSDNNNDYQNFLQTSASDRPSKKRASNLSTISSIISKDNSDNDDVDSQLQRELDMLKSGERIDTEHVTQDKQVSHSDESFVTATSDLPSRHRPAVPVFNIQDVSARDEDARSLGESDAETEKGEATPKLGAYSGRFDQVESQSIYSPGSSSQETSMYPEDTLPISVMDTHDSEATETEGSIGTTLPTREAPVTPATHNSRFDDPVTFDGTPETIKPLSPKNHRVEEELKNMNFNCKSDTPQSEYSSSSSSPVEDNGYEADDAILLRNRPPTEFNPFPKSVIGTGYPTFRDSDLPSKAPPGQGKCRKCEEEVRPDAKGSFKAIFSKTGELSGQWHRGCFSCAYDDCDVKFSKHVSCYVLLDNAFCQHHYHLLNGTLCLTCNLGIEGECIENELKQKWHVNCLQCSRCTNAITKDYFLINGEIVCELDAGQMILEMKDAGMLDTNKIEKRRTRMLFIDQDY